jgi:hypothetical protein
MGAVLSGEGLSARAALYFQENGVVISRVLNIMYRPPAGLYTVPNAAVNGGRCLVAFRRRPNHGG